MKFLFTKVSLLSIFFRILMELTYTNVLNEKYPLTFTLNLDYANYILSWAFFLVFNIVVSNILKFDSELKVSKLILILLFYMSYIPTSIHFGYAGLEFSYFFIFTLYWTILFLFDYLLTRKKVVIYKNRKTNIVIYKFFKSPIYNGIVIFSILLILITSVKLYGSIYIHFGLQDVYDLRLNDDLSSLGTLYSLLLTWAGTVIIPIAALSCFRERKFFKFTILVFVQLVSFSIAGHKMQLFLIPAGLLASKVLTKERIKYLPGAFMGLTIAGLLEIYFLNSDSVVEYIIRRVFFVPALLNSYYVDYFSEMPKLMFFEDMFFRRFAIGIGLNPPYDIAASKLIGINYFGSSEMFANNGMFAYGYADAGIIGVIFSALSLVVILNLLNWVTEDLDIGYTGIVVIIFAMSLISASISSIFYSYLIPVIFFKLFKVHKNRTIQR